MPSVLKENTPETKNRVLSEDIYTFFEQKFGIRQPKPSKQQRKRDKHQRALRRVTQLKNARKELRRANGQGIPNESIQPVTQTFSTWYVSTVVSSKPLSLHNSRPA